MLKRVEVGVEIDRSSRQRREKAGGIQVDVDGMSPIQKRDRDFAEWSEVAGVIQGHLIRPRTIVEKREGRDGAAVHVKSVRRVQIQVRRGGVVDKLERPR